MVALFVPCGHALVEIAFRAGQIPALQAEAIPLRTISIDAISDQLLARKTTEGDYTIIVEAGEHGRLTVGRIMLVARSSGRVAWFWTITGPAAPDAGVGLAGEADNLDAAKAALRSAFDRILYWASMAKNGELGWHVGAERVRG